MPRLKYFLLAIFSIVLLIISAFSVWFFKFRVSQNVRVYKGQINSSFQSFVSFQENTINGKKVGIVTLNKLFLIKSETVKQKSPSTSVSYDLLKLTFKYQPQSGPRTLVFELALPYTTTDNKVAYPSKFDEQNPLGPWYNLTLYYLDSSENWDPVFLDTLCTNFRGLDKPICKTELGDFGKQTYSQMDMKNLLYGRAPSSTIYLDRQSVWVWYMSKVQ